MHDSRYVISFYDTFHTGYCIFCRSIKLTEKVDIKRNNEYFYNIMSTYIIIKNSGETIRIPEDSLVYIQADGNYSKVYTQDGGYYHVNLQLGQLEDSIGNQVMGDVIPFIRIGKSLIVNTRYISVIDMSNLRIKLSDFNGHTFELSASKAALLKLKTLAESDQL